LGLGSELERQGVRLVACTMVDNAGVTRVKGVPVSRIDHVSRVGVGLSNVFAVFAVDDHITSSPGFEGPSGDMRLIPDMGAAVVLAGGLGWAWAPVDQYSQEREPMPVCQRSMLKQAAERALREGLSFKMSLEVEFTLFDAAEQPLHSGPGYSPYAFLPAEDFAVDLVETLTAQGIAVEQIHPEYSTGQYEISVAAGSPLEAADRHVLVRLTIRRLAHRHGLKASFSPVAIPGAVGNGCHLHFSAWRDEDNLMSGGDGPEGLTEIGEHTVAGVLHHLPGMVGFLAPSVASWDRLQPGLWSGAYTCWGVENREAALRMIKGMKGTRERAANVELKAIDGSANPYIAVTLVISAALDGVRNAMRLPPPVSSDPDSLDDHERSVHGIERLPADLTEAIGRMEKAELPRAALGDALCEAFLAVRRFELESYGEVDLQARADLLRWKYG
jgi:glutamine synthetase